MLGFSEREVRHFTIKKWFALFDEYKKYHNFKVSGGLFKIEKTETEKAASLWLDVNKVKSRCMKNGGKIKYPVSR